MDLEFKKQQNRYSSERYYANPVNRANNIIKMRKYRLKNKEKIAIRRKEIGLKKTFEKRITKIFEKRL
jgi:hypothetical protein